MRMSRSTPAGRRQASRAAHVATIPRNTVAPAISGTAQAGQTLTVTNGTWAGNAATYTRQWKRGATNVGAGGLTYVVQAGDVGSTITCTVTATNSTGSVSATSAATGTVIAAAAANLVTNGGFASGANWTLAQQGGSTLPTISGGKVNFFSADDGNTETATQVLAGGSSPAGTYRVTFDYTPVVEDGGDLRIFLLGAGDQVRGQITVRHSSGTAIAEDVVASGEVSKIQLSELSMNATADNIVLELLP